MSFHTTSFNHASGMHGFLHLKYLDQILLPLSIILQPPYRLAWAKICIQPTECKGTSLTAHRSPHQGLHQKSPCHNSIHWALPWPSRTSRVMALKRRRSFKFRLGDGNCSISQKVGHPAFFFNYMLFLFWVTIGRQSGLYRSTYCKVLCLRVFHLGTCVPLRVVLPVQWHLPASRTSIPGQCCHYLELFPTIG